jgi:hypothetical protein
MAPMTANPADDPARSRDLARLCDLTSPHLPYPAAPIGPALARMTPGDRAEVVAILSRLGDPRGRFLRRRGHVTAGLLSPHSAWGGSLALLLRLGFPLYLGQTPVLPWRFRPALAALRLPSRTVATGPTCGAQVAAAMCPTQRMTEPSAVLTELADLSARLAANAGSCVFSEANSPL